MNYWTKSLLIILIFGVGFTAVFGGLILWGIESNQGAPGTYRYEAKVSGLDIATNDSNEALGVYVAMTDGTVNGCVIGKHSNCRPGYTSVLLTEAETAKLKLGDRVVIDCKVSDYTLNIMTVTDRFKCRLVSP